VNAGELAGVITAQKSFVTAATELERHIGNFHSPEELAAGMQEYLRAKKQLQDELEKELPELKAQIAHRKLPTPEGLALGLHLNDFPADRLQHLETTLLTNLEKDASQKALGFIRSSCNADGSRTRDGEEGCHAKTLRRISRKDAKKDLTQRR
jgi:hypothetical protein